MNLEKDSQNPNNILKDLTSQSRLSFVLSFCLLIFLLLSTTTCQTGGKMQESKPVLPKTIGLWTRPDSPRIITANNIFDYMDGAGELYIGYRFDRLEAYEYKAQNKNNILVEVYFMKTSDDAFGLLSLDWGGKSIELTGEHADSAKSQQANAATEISLWPRAIYGEGLLRLWSDTIYARIMAHQETPESKEAVLTLARSLVEERANPPRPDLINKLQDSFPGNWIQDKDETSFFRSHLVLNSVYYLGQENMLNLDLTSEAVTAPYERKDSKGKKRIHFLLVRYPDNKLAHRALSHFHKVYLPEHSLPLRSGSSEEISNAFLIEDGWLVYKFQGNTIAFIFECPDQETARTIINQI